ncbi:MAG: PTS sugar transporter subunit IIB [Clostridia bacterium]|nr:PTS sugar transporter subunit IIB [Clostridia bacterium]
MELVFVRVDSRLIHGQVSTAWVHGTGVNRLMVVNDKAANDPMERALLKMAKPRSIATLDVLTVAQAIGVINKDNSGDKVMLIARTPRDVKGLVDGGINIKKVNLGNMPSGPGRARLDESVCADPEEIEILREMLGAGIVVFSQMTPSSPKNDIRHKL